MHRLLLRLFVPTALLLILCVGAIGLYTHWRTQRDLQGFANAQQAETFTSQARVLAATSLLLYLRDGGWDGVEAHLHTLQIDGSVMIVDRHGIVLAGSNATLPGLSFAPPANAFSAPIGRLFRPGGIAELYLTPPPGFGANQAGFLRSVDRGLLLAGLIGLVAALLVAFVLYKRIAGPIVSMTSAATRMRLGDLQQRVAIPGSRDEVAALASAFNAMADGLQEATRQRRVLTADIAHELRTPLTSVRGFLEAIQDGVVEPSPAVITAIHEEVIVLARLMSDLQDLALADAGALRIHRKAQSLGPILEAAVAAHILVAAGRKITLTCGPVASAPREVLVDALRVGQVLRNLILNALLHTPEGGTVNLACDFTATVASISVRDSGRGIPVEQLDRIFDRFYRADPSRDRATGDAGIGLSVARSIVEAHGGTIRVESVVGSGSTFWIDLPL